MWTSLEEMVQLTLLELVVQAMIQLAVCYLELPRHLHKLDGWNNLLHFLSCLQLPLGLRRLRCPLQLEFAVKDYEIRYEYVADVKLNSLLKDFYRCPYGFCFMFKLFGICWSFWISGCCFTIRMTYFLITATQMSGAQVVGASNEHR